MKIITRFRRDRQKNHSHNFARGAAMTGAHTNAKVKRREIWRYVLGLVAGIEATATQKYFLVRVHHHGYRHKGFAWASPETLAGDMGVSVAAVERIFQWAKNVGVVGEGNRAYWLNIDRLEALQRVHP
jgi:hypothetical protein